MIKSSLTWSACLLIGLTATCFSQDFYTSRTWLNLLYYEQTGTSYKSIADDPLFFVTPSGQTNPKEEYEASLRLTEKQDVFFRKTFPLRYKLIAKHNNLHYEPLVTPNSDVTTAQIVFPNRYMANPTSMFGHLFIILKSRHGLMDSDILHYLADTAGKDPSAYLYNGLTGQFKGWFFREPYYKKIKEDNYVEDRDITYYDLQMSLEQIQNLQLHVTELKKSHFNYYFLDENCAFFTGKLLNVVLDQDIVSRSTLVFPSQIINALYKEQLLTGESLRKSGTSLFNEYFVQLSQSAQDNVIQLLTEETAIVPKDTETLKTFIYISEHIINNHSALAEIIRHNRIKAYEELQKQGKNNVRARNTKENTVSAIKTHSIGLGHGYDNQTSLTYAPIHYSEYASFGELEIKKLNLLASRAILQPKKPVMLELTLADIANITRHNRVLENYSWQLNSRIAYQDTLLSHQSFEIGRTHQVFGHGLAFGFVGVTYSNYDTLTEKPVDLRLNPAINIGLEHHILPGLCSASIAYDHRFNQNYLTAKITFKIQDFIQDISYVQSEEFKGLKFSSTVIF